SNTHHVKLWGYRPGLESDSPGLIGPSQSGDRMDRFNREVMEALRSSSEDWIQTEILISQACSLSGFPFQEAQTILDQIRNLREKNANLRCFEPQVYSFEGFAKRRELPPEDLVPILEMGLSISKEFGDTLSEVDILSTMAWVMRDLDIMKASTLYEEAYSLAQDLEVPFLIADVMSDTALVYELTGEYDLAIACHLEGIEIYNLSHPTVPYLILSRIYSRLGNGQKALNYANRAALLLSDMTFPSFHLRRARALILLDRLEEAEHHLEAAYSQILKSDLEIYLSNYYHMCGQYEQAKGNLPNALNELEKSFEIEERHRRVFWGLDVLFSLADVEQSIIMQSGQDADLCLPGPWMTKLETQLNVHGFPGLLMQFALLKSKFYQHAGQYLDARQTLADALKLSDSNGVRTLRLMIKEKIFELERLIQKST
ncbi:MAG: tetratricopeptide repeat protein, partial [Candidatus Thorarchaeota archaeon]